MVKVAVIGTGIAGLGAAYALSRAHDVELFEKQHWAGGHTNTILLRRSGGDLPLDTGFIVMNERNYPALTRLFRELGVRTQRSEMSFSVSCERCSLEYSGRRPLAQPGNVADAGFRRLLRDVVRFLRTARAGLHEGRYGDATLAELIVRDGYSREFRDHYLMPLTSAIWSAAPARALELPAAFALRFLDNHAMLGFRRHSWRTVVGGSRRYVAALTERIPSELYLRTPVVRLERDADGATVRTECGTARRFDKVVVATHPDQALELLAAPTEEERRLLGSFPYSRNETVLHTDERFLPTAKSARASWNYQIADCRAPSAKPTITYYLNRLQRLDEPEHYCVTLNRTDEIAEGRVIERVVYEHPLVTLESLRAQTALPGLNDRARESHTVYCGAYQGSGFHEDGLVSGLAAARTLGADW